MTDAPTSKPTSDQASEQAPTSNFIRQIINADLAAGKHAGKVVTRFPPEPNGYLHIGHAKSICLNFGIARDYAGAVCHLRFDDTNPAKEELEFVDAIKTDVAWLGFDWQQNLFHSSDYFEQLYQFSIKLIEMGKAYVCDLNAEEIREYRGTLTEAGRDSPWRDRTVEESLDLLQRMRAGEFADGSRVLRAKIDMASPNMNMRDPALYRVKHATHPITGDAWCIYPMYDFTHCLSDAIEGITHSLCTLEFEDHRPLYDWLLDTLNTDHHPQQIEFSRLNLDYTIMSKRKLHTLVAEGKVSGWDDPRMPTISGLRRRGYTAAAIREFCQRIGVTRHDNIIEMGVLESCIREDLEAAPRVLGVVNPLKLVITNYPAGQVEQLTAQNHPQRPEMGSRDLPFSGELYVERDDFMEEPPKKFFRLGPGREVRLRYGYYVTCTDVIKDAAGEVIEIHCTYDPATRGGSSPDGRKVKGTIHWVSAAHALDAEVRLYDRLFNEPNPAAAGDDFLQLLNPDSLRVMGNAKLEPGLAEAKTGIGYQFERLGYFCVDKAAAGQPVFNRTVTLRDSWAKMKR
ncbi:MAG: glutamine--tRNA ligase [Gammaproteobacteria bacterium]|nr:MAG: glutamine--tRNA ligase [Gammaproteobacteria bacterium]RLA15079.1 MAG: glutamine--tRNA ligase [Gammaproteobacteria bacterium]